MTRDGEMGGWGDGGDGGDVKIDVHLDPLGSSSTSLVALNRESMESNLTHLRLPGLKIGDGQHKTKRE